MDNCPCEKCILQVICINKTSEALMCCSIVSDLIIDDVYGLIDNVLGVFPYYLPALNKQFYFYINQLDDMYIHRDDGFGYNWVARK